MSISASTVPGSTSEPAKGRIRVPQAAAILAVALLVFFGAHFVNSNFPSFPILQSVLTLSLFLATVAFGQGLAMLTGGLDLSIPGVIAVSSTVAALWVSVHGGSEVVAVLLALGAAALVGLINGLGVARFGIPAFIMTLAVGSVVEGITIGATRGRKAPESPEQLITLFSGSGKLLGIGLPVLFFFLVGLIGFIIQAKSRFGRTVYLVGSSLEAARIGGLPVRRIQVLVYVVSGLSSGIAGLMLLGFTGNATLSLGEEWLMPAISAVLVGGTVIGSGRGAWESTLAAVVLLTVITVVISATGLSEGWKQVLYGAIVLIALVITRPATSLRGLLHRSRGKYSPATS